MTPEYLSLISGALLSLLLAYVPPFSTWWNPKPPDVKRMITGGLIVVVGLAIYGLSCAGWLVHFFPQLVLTCDQQGIAKMISTILLALAANQSVYAVLPKRGAQ